MPVGKENGKSHNQNNLCLYLLLSEFSVYGFYVGERDHLSLNLMSHIGEETG